MRGSRRRCRAERGGHEVVVGGHVRERFAGRAHAGHRAPGYDASGMALARPTISALHVGDIGDQIAHQARALLRVGGKRGDDEQGGEGENRKASRHGQLLDGSGRWMGPANAPSVVYARLVPAPCGPSPPLVPEPRPRFAR